MTEAPCRSSVTPTYSSRFRDYRGLIESLMATRVRIGKGANFKVGFRPAVAV